MRLFTLAGFQTAFARLVLGPAVLLLAASAAPAQQIWGGSAAADPMPFAEDFDTSPLEGWEYSCQHALVPTQSGQALLTSGAGHAIWTAPGDVRDFVLKFRYGFEQGVGDVVFRMSDTPHGMECYCLKLEPQGISLVRRLHTAGRGYPEQELAGVPGTLQPRQWHDITIQAIGGRIDVAVGDQHVLSYTDPAPLVSGPCGLGVIAHSGAVLYDDAVLTPLSPVAGAAATPRNQVATTWP